MAAGLRRWWRLPYNWLLSRTRAVSSVGQSASFTPRRSEVQVLHRPPCRKGLPEPGGGPGSPGRGGGTADALRSGRSILTDVWVQIPPSAPTPAKLAQRHPSCACSSVDRALPCGGRGREFESRQAHHFFSPSPDPQPLLPVTRRLRGSRILYNPCPQLALCTFPICVPIDLVPVLCDLGLNAAYSPGFPRKRESR